MFNEKGLDLNITRPTEEDEDGERFVFPNFRYIIDSICYSLKIFLVFFFPKKTLLPIS